jgi:hypothetical protein
MARVRLILAVGLAALWTGWLAYEAWTAGRPVVVSHPQLLLAPVVVEAEVGPGEGPSREVKVVAVYRGQSLLGVPGDTHETNGPVVRVTNLGEAAGLAGPGRYILALYQEGDGAKATYEVVPIPASPGFPALAHGPRAVVYPVTASTRLQVGQALRGP